MTENLIDNLSSLIPFFQSEAASRTPKSISSYRQALASLTSFLNLSSTSPALSSSTLSAWAIYMALNGLSRKTIIYYFDIIAAMYGAAVKKGLSSPTPLFSTIKAKLKEIDVRLWDNQISIEGFSRLLILTKSSYNLKGALSLAADLSLLSLLNGCLPLSSIAEWRNASLPTLEPESKEIALRHAAPNRKYVFPLDQSRRTPRQLDSFISILFSDLFRLRNIPVFGSPDSTLRSYWAYAALSAGIDPSEILAITGSVVGFPLLSLFPPATLSETRRKEIINSVASIFLVNPLGWFAMRLRPHISFEELSQRFDSLSKEKILTAPSIFYPYDEIARRTGKKMKFERKPVIRDVVFFNSRITDILPMFSKIGDLAWCYTVTGRPG
ncbi:MAG: phage integrase SAM-like domain-containing protein, partial [Muribaculaceae bacterium]|nr:phage integrase SAM-like domain-containing protein [Muribaculaceae bacterium]